MAAAAPADCCASMLSGAARWRGLFSIGGVAGVGWGACESSGVELSFGKQTKASFKRQRVSSLSSSSSSVWVWKPITSRIEARMKSAPIRSTNAQSKRVTIKPVPKVRRPSPWHVQMGRHASCFRAGWPPRFFLRASSSAAKEKHSGPAFVVGYATPNRGLCEMQTRALTMQFRRRAPVLLYDNACLMNRSRLTPSTLHRTQQARPGLHRSLASATAAAGGTARRGGSASGGRAW